ncbi:MAG: response regulator [Alphaproteobacteria bacterium]|nr:response regulator [Alphaproteobacteria bacterium]
MDIIHHTTPALLVSFLDEIERSDDDQWGIVRIKKNQLRSVTNEAFLLAIKPALQNANPAHVFFIDKRIYILWRGHQKPVYQQLRALLVKTLTQPGLDSASAAPYLDPRAKGKAFKAALQAPRKDQLGDPDDSLFNPADAVTLFGNLEVPVAAVETSPAALALNQEQIEMYQDVRLQKLNRRQLQILIVEDQVFSQKLLGEILRDMRAHNHQDTPLIDMAQGIQEAWKIYLRKAPDLVFVDLGLIDGSGHTLARAIKQLDPSAHVIIVTANNFEEEISVAQQNHVDGFIAKPYNKKQIFDCIDRYLAMARPKAKGTSRGTTNQFR